MRLSGAFWNRKQKGKKTNKQKKHPDPIDKHLFINFHFIFTGMLYFDVDTFSFLEVSLKRGYCCAMQSGFVCLFVLFLYFNQCCPRCCSDSKRKKISRLACVWLRGCSQSVLGEGAVVL